MDRGELAAQLRDRLLRRTDVSHQELSSFNDDDIIGAFITCKCCGEKMITSVQLNEVIEKSTNDEEFIINSELEKYNHVN